MKNHDLADKLVDVDQLAQDALIDEELFAELLREIKSKDNTIRSNSYRTLLIISEEEPEFLYPHWNYFADMLKSPNNYHKFIAIYILANLTRVDDDNKFLEIFDDYYGILGGDKVMNASHVAANSPIIIKNKPELQERIIEKLLNIENIHQGKQKELVKAYAIEALRKIYPDAPDKEKIMEFVKDQLESSSPKTRDMASCFLDRC
ncbi:MAG: hypothetical protein LUQ24_09225 [Methanobacterium sp.]|nr:hypothetical protein [Methanobacterium sp.]